MHAELQCDHTWQLLQIQGERVCQRTASRSGYLVLTDGQQTHQVPVRAHREAALENHSPIVTRSQILYVCNFL